MERHDWTFIAQALCFFCIFPFLQRIIQRSCACKISRKWKRWKTGPTEIPLSHKKHCFLNASSVVPPLIEWLGDMTLCQHVIHSHNLCLADSLAQPQLLCCCQWCWVRRAGAGQSEETMYLRQELQCCNTRQYEETRVFSALKHVNLF